VHPVLGYPAINTVDDILAQQYISNITELPYSSGIPTVIWQKSGNIKGWIDIIGYKNLSRRGDSYYIFGAPTDLAIVAGDAIANLPSYAYFDRIDKSILLSQLDNNTIATLNVVLLWHTISCDKWGCYVSGRFKDVGSFQDIEQSPKNVSSNDDVIEVLYREMNFSFFNTIDVRIRINETTYDSFILTTNNGSYEKINRLWRSEKTDKGVYFANESSVNIFHSNNIGHAQDVIDVANLNFTVNAMGLYFSTNKTNTTIKSENHDPLPQFIDGTLIGFISIIGLFYLYIKRIISRIL
jgi:hypothetical protein